MLRLRTTLLALAAALVVALPMAAEAGVQVASCTPAGGDKVTYRFFACTAGQPADELEIRLLSAGSKIEGAAAPNLPGFGATFSDEVANYTCPTVDPFRCAPGLPGVFFEVTISGGATMMIVEEIWKMNGSIVSGFGSLITCPPISVEDSSWGQVKSLYR